MARGSRTWREAAAKLRNTKWWSQPGGAAKEQQIDSEVDLEARGPAESTSGFQAAATETGKGGGLQEPQRTQLIPSAGEAYQLTS